MFSVGIDLGSRFVKIAKSKNNKIELLKYDTIKFYKEYIEKDKESLLINNIKLDLPKECNITATGYGRNLMSFNNAKVISEIKAHFKGGLYSTKFTDFILIDIGGQDSKVIYGKDGYIEDFIMNDKCAASSGRFAENACNILGISLEDLSNMISNPTNLSTTCSVFCESEIISKIASGVSIESIGAGINLSIAKRIKPLIQKFSSPIILASGGVAKNKSLIQFISELINQEIQSIEQPEYNGAIGCIY